MNFESSIEEDTSARTFNEQHDIETYKSLLSIAVEVFKYLALLNGGAAAGMVAGIDKIGKVLTSHDIKISLILFVSGLTCSALSIMVGWLSLYSLHYENIEEGVEGLHVVGIGIALTLIFASLTAFGTGALWAGFHLQ